MRRLLPLLVLLLAGLPCHAQTGVLKDFKPMCDSLTARTVRRFGTKGEISLWKAVKNKNGKFDLHFTRDLSDWPWRADDAKWFRRQVEDLYPAKHKTRKGGKIYCRSTLFEDLLTPEAGNNGRTPSYRYSPGKKAGAPVVTGLDNWKRGLSGRTIALWQSHGRYYNEKEDAWMWQRAPIHRTIEDLYTQSYVLPYLIPMLENAGAYVMTPRERDINPHEVMCDNDPSFARDTVGIDFGELPLRVAGAYKEKGKWQDAGIGFADLKALYSKNDNPFKAGTARMAKCALSQMPSASAVWTPDIPERGEYAVYISYKTWEHSSKAVRYTVKHMGGEDIFIVDQSKGGGTWIYLGTFEFDKGTQGCVTVDNAMMPGAAKSSWVSADAVKFGGGICKIARGLDSLDVKVWEPSYLPSYLEGAMYWMQWAGIDYDRVINNWNGDYKRDYASRGAWVCEMKDKLGVPVDLSLAFHTDAGTSPNDSIVGTLSIYTLNSGNSRKYSDGHDRMGGRLLADFVQSQVVGDLRAEFNPEWSRRQLWDRSYAESRSTDVPGMILELLSHQNFADMKYGHDPAFKFAASRAVYKGVLKFLGCWYGTPYTVQPLPVKDFSAVFCSRRRVKLSWAATEDELEPTARPSGYIVYTKIDSGAFDAGVKVKDESLEVDLEPGKLYSWKIVAFNDGGLAFPSEILSAGVPGNSKGEVLVVNNFTRVSGPAWFDTPGYAGFDGQLDGGVPYIRDISFCGDNYEIRRGKRWITDYAPGFGASDTGSAGLVIAGNSFDFPAVHGRALMDSGWSFCSQSVSAFNGKGTWAAVDIICGKQVSTLRGKGTANGAHMSADCQVFPATLREAVKAVSAAGSGIIVSGADIATDAWDCIYPIADTCATADGAVFARYQRDAREFAQDFLGFKWISSRTGNDGILQDRKTFGRSTAHYRFRTEPNALQYCVENADGIQPTGKDDKVLLYYSSKIPAAIVHRSSKCRSAVFGFPLESLLSKDDLSALLARALTEIAQ
ncbi:MAG: xanthan lyase [Bacteroidales bacterium]|nr:xanthan lyase [Bacteroidales bacterium]